MTRYQIAHGTIYRRTQHYSAASRAREGNIPITLSWWWSRALRVEKPVTYDEADLVVIEHEGVRDYYVFALPPGALPFTHILVAARYVAKIA